MYKTLLITSLFTAGLFVLPLSASAEMYGSPNCQPIYGGGETCLQSGKVVLDKKVLHPKSQTTKGGAEEFVDNLTMSDPKYAPDQTVKFQLTVTNTGTETVKNVKVQDTLPQYVTYVSGRGTFDANTKVYTETIETLAANESKTIVLTARVAPMNDLPADKGVVCIVNQAMATVDNNSSEDNAQLCVEKPVAPTKSVPQKTVPGETKGGLKVYPPTTAKQTPPTGPEMFALVGLVPSALAGFALRRKSK